MPASVSRRAAILVAAALLTILIVGVAAIAEQPPAPARQWSIASPEGGLTATVEGRGGAFALTVRRRGRNVLQTPLGRADARGRIRAVEDTVDDRYVTPAGKRRNHRLVARRLTLALPRGRKLELLAADDGIAFRLTGWREATAWSAPRGARAWLQRYRPEYEGPYQPTALGAAGTGDYGFPALLRTGDTGALLTESGLTREPAAHLSVVRRRPGVLGVALPAGASAPHATPWRVAVIGDLPAVVRSDLPLSLGRPSQIGDTSWIRPGRVAWSWWSDNDSPRDAARQRAFVRSASGMTWEYVLVDEGWNAGAVPGLVRYAASRHVRIMLWTDWKALRDPRQRDRKLAQWASWGVAGVKVDFLLSDSASRMAVMDDIARAAARRKLAVVFHGCTIPRGIQRTWPNVLTMEAVEGTERETSGQGSQAMDPHHEINLVFTRNVIGSMDYTPVTFSARNRRTTEAHRLALAVTYESGLQHFADTPESYARHPAAVLLLRDLPTAWDDTRLLAGAPDLEAIVARRAGEAWWIGSISAAPAHRQSLALGFLTPGRSYRLRLVRDDGRGGLAAEERTVTSADRLDVAVETHGGFTAEITPQGAQ